MRWRQVGPRGFYAEDWGSRPGMPEILKCHAKTPEPVKKIKSLTTRRQGRSPESHNEIIVSFFIRKTSIYRGTVF